MFRSEADMTLPYITELLKYCLSKQCTGSQERVVTTMIALRQPYINNIQREEKQERVVEAVSHQLKVGGRPSLVCVCHS